MLRKFYLQVPLWSAMILAGSIGNCLSYKYLLIFGGENVYSCGELDGIPSFTLTFGSLFAWHKKEGIFLTIKTNKEKVVGKLEIICCRIAILEIVFKKNCEF